MKRVMMTAFALALLGGTSVLAAPQRDDDRGGRFERGGGQRSEGQRGDGQRGGGENRDRPQAQERQREAPAQRPTPQAAPQVAPQAAPQARQDRGGRPDFNRRPDGQRGQPQTAQVAPQAAPRVAPQGRPGSAQVMRGLSEQQARAQALAQTQGLAPQDRGRGRDDGGRVDGRNGRSPDNDGRVDGRNGRGDRDSRNDRQGDGRNWNGRDGNDRWDRRGPPQGRPQNIRPQDRYDRDRNRPRYERNRWVFLIQPRQHYYWRGPTYYAPYDFYPRSFAYGQVLPWSWYTHDYYINDWAFYGLPMPPIGCEWIRLGDDAVLVDVFTGRTLSVVYSLFW